MKKFLLLLITFSILVSCGKDEENRFVENDYVSDIKIDGETFIPSPRTASKSYVTTWAYDITDGAKTRMFHLVQHNDKEELRQYLEIVVTYQGHNATGTHALPEDWFIDNEGNTPGYNGAYIRGFEYDGFSDGTITVNEMGNNKFRIRFNDVKTNSVPSKAINGSFEGTFTYAAPEL